MHQLRRLLGDKVERPRTSVADRTPRDVTTRETYLGYARIENLVNPAVAFDREAAYRFPRSALADDQVSYSGRWTIEASHATAGRDARLRLRFQANDVFLVLAGEGAVHAFVNGQPKRTIRVSGTPRLYAILRYSRLTRGLLELRFEPGLEGYAFTFG